MSKPTGIILYTGKSLFDGKNVVVIATGIARKTHNVKTGDMIQTFIIKGDMNPVAAWLDKKDGTICGTCNHREWDTCYVNKAFSPNHVYRAYKRGRYPKLNNENIKFFDGRVLRIGSYGDPTAVPIEVWEKVVTHVKSFSGYTHNWTKCDQNYKKYCMASTDTVNETDAAQKKGWRTFRINVDARRFKNEIVCPASAEANKSTTCHKCTACNGITSKLPKSVTIKIHGKMTKRFIDKVSKLKVNFSVKRNKKGQYQSRYP